MYMDVEGFEQEIPGYNNQDNGDDDDDKGEDDGTNDDETDDLGHGHEEMDTDKTPKAGGQEEKKQWYKWPHSVWCQTNTKFDSTYVWNWDHSKWNI